MRDNKHTNILECTRMFWNNWNIPEGSEIFYDVLNKSEMFDNFPEVSTLLKNISEYFTGIFFFLQ